MSGRLLLCQTRHRQSNKPTSRKAVDAAPCLAGLNETILFATSCGSHSLTIGGSTLRVWQGMGVGLERQRYFAAF